MRHSNGAENGSSPRAEDEARRGIADPQKSRHDAAEEARRAALNLMEDAIASREALRASEEKYRTLFESIDQGFGILELIYNGTGRVVDCRFLEVNGSFEQQTNLKNVVGKLRSEIEPVMEDYWLELYEKVARTGKAQRVERCNPETGRWFSVYASPIGGAGSRQVATIFDDITEDKRVDEALRRSGEMFSTLVENAPFGVYLIDSDFRLRTINAGSREVFSGIEPLIGRDFAEVLCILWPEPFANEAIARFRHTLETGESFISQPIIEKRANIDEIQSYDWQLHRVTLPDGSFGVVCYFYDLSEQKRLEASVRASEAKLRFSEERFRQFAENSADVFWIMDAKTKKLEYLNPVYEKMFGQSRQLLFEDRENRLDLVPPEDREEAAGGVESAIEGKTFVRNYRIVRSNDREQRWIRDTGFPIRDATGEVVRIAGVAQDVTEDKERSEALRKSETTFRAVANLVPDLLWSLDGKGAVDWVNQRWVDFTGQSATEAAGEGWFAAIHLDDVDEVRQKLNAALVAGKAMRHEQRFRAASGDYRWFLVQKEPVYDDASQAIRWFAAATDIHEQRIAWEALRESEEKLRLLIEGAPDYAMFLMDPDNTITYWSAGAEKVFGWSAEEAVGQTGALIFTPEDRKKGAVEKERGTARDQGFAPDRRWHLRKDGSRLWVDGIMRRLDRSDGLIRGYAKIGRDATDLRESEDALLHARDEMEQRVVERTAELVAMNNELEDAMRARQQLERELLDISEREKRRIGEDLHDIICQELSAAALYLKSSANQTEKKNPAAAKTLTDAANIVNRNVTLARNLARGFQPVQLSGGQFTAALRALVSQTNKSHRDINCRAEIPRTLHIADETVALNLYRIAQEAITNAIKHSGADEVVLFLKRERNRVRLTVEDNGSGFRPRKRSKGLGMHIMQYRTTVLGGDMTVETNPKKGTRITTTVPVKSSVRESD